MLSSSSFEYFAKNILSFAVQFQTIGNGGKLKHIGNTFASFPLLCYFRVLMRNKSYFYFVSLMNVDGRVNSRSKSHNANKLLLKFTPIIEIN